jgi:tetratricopeptide (TPR) repeat protein
MKRQREHPAPNASSPRRAPSIPPSVVAPMLVALVTFIAFAPVLRNDFVAWDDDKNFLENPSYRGLGLTQLRWMWSTFQAGHYVPLTWMSHGLDFVLWGMNPTGYHLTNLLLHVANAVLVYHLARRLLPPRAPTSSGAALRELLPAVVAALFFAIHPLRVESVAWATERRDVLSGLFYFASLLTYVRGSLRGDAPRRWYWATLVLFIAALLSKATAMTLPALLLLLDVYPLRRLGGAVGWWTVRARRVYLEKLPFVVLALLVATLSIVALRPPEQLATGGKIAVSAYSLVFYLWKTVAPVGLSPLYSMPLTVDVTLPRYLGSYALLLLLSLAAFCLRRRVPSLGAIWIAFVLITLPMLGIVQNGWQIAADRYTYHSGPALALLAGGVFAWGLRHASRATSIITAALLLSFGTLTWGQTGVWHDSDSLWHRVLALEPQSFLGNAAIGDLLLQHERPDEAIAYYERALAVDPRSAPVRKALGVALTRAGNRSLTQRSGEHAIANYERSIALNPGSAEAHTNLGVALARENRTLEAIVEFRRALEIDPRIADVHFDWANALFRAGKLDGAVSHYRDAIRLRPGDADSHYNLGVALKRQQKLDEAILEFSRTLAINPERADARASLEAAESMRTARQ